MKFSHLRNKILISLVIILIISVLSFFQKEVKNLFYFISSPIQKSFWRTGQGIGNFFKAVSKIESFEKEKQELETKNTQLLSENIQLKELKKENEILREALSLQLQKEFKLKTAEVISRDSSQDFILINKGSKDGIKKDMPVITQKKALCGRVFEVYEDFSKIMLITSASSSFDAKISENDIFGVVKGKGNLSLDLTLIPKDKEIKTGDLVITTTLGGIFPKGLLIGEIKEVKKSDVEPFQSANLKPFFDIQDLEIVFLIASF